MTEAKLETTLTTYITNLPGENTPFKIHFASGTLDAKTFENIMQLNPGARKKYENLKKQTQKGNRDIYVKLSPDNNKLIMRVVEQKTMATETAHIRTE